MPKKNTKSKLTQKEIRHDNWRDYSFCLLHFHLHSRYKLVPIWSELENSSNVLTLATFGSIPSL